MQVILKIIVMKINTVVVIWPISIQLRHDKKHKCMMEEKQVMAAWWKYKKYRELSRILMYTNDKLMNKKNKTTSYGTNISCHRNYPMTDVSNVVRIGRWRNVNTVRNNPLKGKIVTSHARTHNHKISKNKTYITRAK